jgi:predicted nuclease of predicted toxin-antitoxin system
MPGSESPGRITIDPAICVKVLVDAQLPARPATGNISNDDLLTMFVANLEQIADALDAAPLEILGPKSLSAPPRHA